MTEVIVKEQLIQLITKIERLESEKSGIMEDIKDSFSEAKAVGFDVKTLKKVLKIRKMDRDALAEEEALLELYRDALGL